MCLHESLADREMPISLLKLAKARGTDAKRGLEPLLEMEPLLLPSMK